MGDEGEQFDIVLTGGGPWGFRLQGGREFRSPLQVAKVTGGGKAAKAGLKERDNLVAINGADCDNCLHNDALQRVKSATSTLKLTVHRGAAPRRTSGVFDDRQSLTSPSTGSGPVAPPWSRSSTTSARTSSSTDSSLGASTSSSGASESGSRAASTSTPVVDGNGRAPNTEKSTSPVPAAASVGAQARVPPAALTPKPTGGAGGKRGSSGSADPASTTDGASQQKTGATIPTDVPAVDGGRGNKEKGWYKEMFKSMHAAGPAPDGGGPSATTSSSTKYDSRKSLPIASLTSPTSTKPVPKWTSSRSGSSSSASVASSARAFDDRRTSVPVTASSTSYTRRSSSRDPPPSVSARKEFFRNKEVAAKDSGLSPVGGRSAKGVNSTSPASTWSQRHAAAQTAQSSSTLPAGSRQGPASVTAKPTTTTTNNKSSSLPRSTPSPSSTLANSKRSTPSPSLAAPAELRRTPSPTVSSPRAAEGYNTLNAALSDLNEAISSLEGATITAAEKEGKKKTPWRPSETRDAPVLHTQSPDHQGKMEGVLEKKRVSSGGAITQPKTQPAATMVMRSQPKPEPVVFPAEVEPEPEVKAPSPRPASPKQTVQPVAVAEKPPSTRVSVEPEAQIVVQQPVEAFVIDLSSFDQEHFPAPISSDPVPAASMAEPIVEEPMPREIEAAPAAQENSASVVVEPAPYSMAADMDALLGMGMSSQFTQQLPDPEPEYESEPVSSQPEPEPAEPEPVSSQPQPEPVAQPQSNSKQVAAVAVIADKVEVTQEDESTDGLATAPTSDGPAIPPLEPGEGYGVAVFSFNPQSKRELTLRKGDDIILTRKVDANWMEGKVGSGSKGIFPRTYVKVFLAPTVVAQRGKSPAAKTPEPAAQPTSSGSDVGSSTSTSSSNATNSQPVQTREKKAENQQGSAKARFSFQAENVRELSLKKGEEVTLLRKVDNNWYEATLGPGIKGIVPTTYLEIVEDVSLMDKRVSGTNQASGSGTKSPPGRPTEGPKRAPSNPESPASNPESPPAAASPASASSPMLASPQKELAGERFVAVYPYASQNEDELELGEGDIVYVVEQCTDGWFVGTSERTRDFGTFPGNYVTAA